MTARASRALATLSACAATSLGATACGGDDDFANEPRPPIPLQLTGVITDDEVTVSPNQVGAGPIILNVSNQTDQVHTVTLEGEGVEERVGPIKPLDTAAIQKTLEPGSYEVSAGSPVATPKEIQPGLLTIGPERDTSSDDLLLP